MTSSGKKIVSNSIILLSSLVISRFFHFVLVIFSARLLGDANYGIFSFALAFTSLFLILSDFGVHQLMVRELARKPDKVESYLGNTITIKVVLALLTFAMIVLVVNLTNKPDEVRKTVYLMGAFQILFSFIEYFKAIFQAFQKMLYDAMVTILLALLTAIFGIALLLSNGTYAGLAAMYCFASLFSLMLCVLILVRKFTYIKMRFDWKLIKYFLVEGFPFGLLHFFSMIYIYMSTVLLSFLVGDQAVGWYNASYRLIVIMLFIPQATMKAIFPVLSKFYESSIENFERLFEKAFKSMFIVGITMAFIFSLLSDKIVLLMYGNEYINSANILKIMVWSSAFVFMTTTMTHTTRSSNRQRFTAKVVTLGAVLNIILNLILIPKFSYMGAAYAYLITEILIFAFHFFYVSKQLFTPPLIKLAPKVFAINAVMCGYILYFIKWNVLLLIPTSLVVNIVMVFLLKYFDPDELSLLRQIIKTTGTRS